MKKENNETTPNYRGAIRYYLVNEDNSLTKIPIKKIIIRD